MPRHTFATPNRTAGHPEPAPRDRDGRRRWLARALIITGLVALTVGMAAAPASAHAVLLDTSPNPGQVLDRSPSQILLRFNESVDAGLGAIRLYDGTGARLDLSTPTRPDPDVLVVDVPNRLTDGSYVVTWRVISADSHPVRGGFTFQIGTAADASGRRVTALTRRLVDEQSGDATVGVLYGIARAGVFGGLAVLLGSAVFLFGISSEPVGARARRIVWSSWAVVAGSTLGGLLLLGPYGAGEGVTKVFDPDLLGEVLRARYGEAWAARLLLLALAVPVLRGLLAAKADRRRRLALGAGIAVGLAATITLSGHAVAGRWVAAAIPTDLAHVLAMSSWLGGLVVVVAVSLPGRDLQSLRRVLPKFSRLGLCAVGVLVVTGTFQGVRQVGNLDALRNTDYGHLLIIKICLVAVVVLFAYRSRGVVRRLAVWLTERSVPVAAPVAVVAGGSDDDTADGEWFDEQVELRILRTSVFAEVVVAVAIIIVTALLVNAVPARSANSLGAQGATGITLKSSKLWIDVTLAPGRAGANNIHVFAITPGGAPVAVQDLTLSIELPSRRIGPIKVPLRRVSTDHGYSPGFDIPIAGTWRLTAKAVVTEFDEVTLRGTVVIR